MKDLIGALESSSHASTALDCKIYEAFGFVLDTLEYSAERVFGVTHRERVIVTEKPEFTGFIADSARFDRDVAHITLFLHQTIGFFQTLKFFQGCSFAIGYDPGQGTTVTIKSPDGRNMWEARGETAALAFCASMVKARTEACCRLRRVA